VAAVLQVTVSLFILVTLTFLGYAPSCLPDRAKFLRYRAILRALNNPEWCLGYAATMFRSFRFFELPT
jgi:hypothetical protein